VSLIDISTIPDMSIPVIDPQGELVVAAIVTSIVAAFLLRLRVRRRPH
jgi:hypothetical protein